MRGIRSADPSLALPSRARAHLLLRVLFAVVPDSWIDWPPRNSSRCRVPSGCCAIWSRACSLLVRAFIALDIEQLGHVDGAVLDRHDRRFVARSEFFAARHAGDLLRLLSLIHINSAGFLGIS